MLFHGVYMLVVYYSDHGISYRIQFNAVAATSLLSFCVTWLGIGLDASPHPPLQESLLVCYTMPLFY
jgi:hypothetical protein